MTQTTTSRAFAVLLALYAALPVARAADPAGRDVSVVDLIKKCLPAYVFVGGGSGAIISADGYVITNAHVTRGHKRWKLRTPDGKYRLAWVIGASRGTDLALLKIDHAEGLPYLPLGNSDQLGVGDAVIAIGNPFALGNIDGKPTVTLGVVSALHVDRPHAYDAVQTDTPINPGNSGGPLINLKGELIGVNAQIQTRFGLRQNTGVGYAISSNQVKRFLPALKVAEGREVATGKIQGLVLDHAPDGPAVIKAVRKDSDAAKAGLLAGDTIFALDNAPVSTIRDFAGALGRYPIGAEAVLKVRRKQPPAEHAFKVTIGKFGRVYHGINFSFKSGNSLVVRSVDPNSPAARAGVKKGDVIIGLNRRPIRSRTIFRRFLTRFFRPGMRMQLILRRGKKRVGATITLSDQD